MSQSIAPSLSPSTPAARSPKAKLLIQPLEPEQNLKEPRNSSHLYAVRKELIDTIRELSPRFVVARPSDGEPIPLYTLSNFQIISSTAQKDEKGDKKQRRWYWPLETKGQLGHRTAEDTSVVVVDADTYTVLQLLKREILTLDKGFQGVTLSEADIALFKTFVEVGADEVVDDLPDIGYGFVKKYRSVFGFL